METIIQVLIGGLLVGGIYALISMGLNLIYGVVGIVNFAHGEFLMLSMYASYFLFQYLGIDPYLSILIVAPLFYIFGTVVHRLIFQPLLKAPEVSQIFAAFGLLLVLQNTALFLWKADYRSVTTTYSTLALDIGNFQVSFPRLVAFVAALIIMLGLYYFLKKTYTGKAIRATAQDTEAAQLMGIKTSRIYLMAFGIGSALVGIAGALLISFYAVFPSLGSFFVLVAFVVVVLGGLGSIEGAFFGGLIIGVVEGLSGYFLGTAFKEAVYFIIFWIVLVYKPSGLFGSSGQK